MQVVTLKQVREAGSVQLGNDLDVSMEGFLSDFIGRVGDSIRNARQNLVNASEVERLTSDENRFLSLIKEQNYLSISALKVNIPEGLRVPLLEHARVVKEMNLYSRTVMEDTIKPFKRFLADLITKPQTKYQIDPRLAKTFKERSVEREKLMATVNAQFSQTFEAYVTYDRAIEQNKEWSELFESVRSFTNHRRIDQGLINKEVDEVISLLDQVKELIADDESGFKKLNSKLTSDLAELTEHAAKDVAFLGTTYYHTQSLVVKLNANVKDLIRKLR